MTEKQQELFESKSVWNAIFTMAVPAMVTMVVMILYNMADMYFVGRTGDTVQVAAVSLVGPVFSIMMAIGSMLGGGACALIAKTLGGKEYRGSTSVFKSLLLGRYLFWRNFWWSCAVVARTSSYVSGIECGDASLCVRVPDCFGDGCTDYDFCISRGKHLKS